MKRPCLATLVGAALTAALAAPAARAEPMPITLSGYNRDVVTDADPSARFATSFDGPPTLAAWFQAGTEGHANGLPTGQDFTSATGSGAAFHLQPADGNNILRLGGDSPNTGTLSLAIPQAFRSLALLDSSGSAFGRINGTVVLHFTDGTTASLGFLSFDWNQATPGAEPFVALGDRGRNASAGADGRAFTYDGSFRFALYESDLDLAALGLDGKAIESLTFSQPDGTFGSTGIFGVSGTPSPAPEPSALALAGIGAVGLIGYVWRRRLSRMLTVSAGGRAHTAAGRGAGEQGKETVHGPWA
jgi:hypothetical protein